MDTNGRAFPPTRQLADGLYWLRGGDCYIFQGEMFGLGDDVRLHQYHSMFVIQGESESLLVDTGSPKDWSGISAGLDELVAAGVPEPSYIFPTHAEVPHSGNLGRLLQKFPAAIVCGDIRDYHLLFPESEGRCRAYSVGDCIDLGGTQFVVREAVIRDLPTSLWGYDTRSGALFVADGFNFTHYHGAEECGKVAEEIPNLPISDFVAVVTGLGLYWTQFTDMEPLIVQIDKMVGSEEYPVKMIAPAHSCPVVDPEVTLPKLKAGLRRARGITRAGLSRQLAERRLGESIGDAASGVPSQGA